MVSGALLISFTCFHPTIHHTAMRGYWARDDPAFLLILLTIMAGKILKYTLIFSNFIDDLLSFSIGDRLWSVAKASCVGILPGFAVDCA